LFSDMPQVGLTDYLEDPSLNVWEIIHPIGIERLRVIPAGGRRETPTEYFTSVRMRQMLDGVLDRYPERYVILDAPPMTEAADAHMLAQLSDFVLLVAPYGRVTVADVAAVVKEIPAEKVLGLVFNDEPGLPTWSWREMLKEAFAGALRMVNPLGRKTRTVT
jgi:protein-tyrosine kinase